MRKPPLMSFIFSVSPEYFHAAGTALQSGRIITWHDDKDAPRVAVINQEFARKVFGSVTNGMGRYFKRKDGTRLQVVGIVEDGKYNNLTEDQQPAMFLPILQSPSTQTYLAVRSDRDPGQLRRQLSKHRAGSRCRSASLHRTVEQRTGQRSFSFACCGDGFRVYWASWARYSPQPASSEWRRTPSAIGLKELGIRMALGAQRREVLQAALGRAHSSCSAFGSTQQDCSLAFLASRVLAVVVYPRNSARPTGDWQRHCRRHGGCWGCWLRGFQRNARCRSIL